MHFCHSCVAAFVDIALFARLRRLNVISYSVCDGLRKLPLDNILLPPRLFSLLNTFLRSPLKSLHLLAKEAKRALIWEVDKIFVLPRMPVVLHINVCAYVFMTGVRMFMTGECTVDFTDLT